MKLCRDEETDLLFNSPGSQPQNPPSSHSHLILFMHHVKTIHHIQSRAIPRHKRKNLEERTSKPRNLVVQIPCATRGTWH